MGARWGCRRSRTREVLANLRNDRRRQYVDDQFLQLLFGSHQARTVLHGPEIDRAVPDNPGHPRPSGRAQPGSQRSMGRSTAPGYATPAEPCPPSLGHVPPGDACPCLPRPIRAGRRPTTPCHSRPCLQLRTLRRLAPPAVPTQAVHRRAEPCPPKPALPLTPDDALPGRVLLGRATPAEQNHSAPGQNRQFLATPVLACVSEPRYCMPCLAGRVVGNRQATETDFSAREIVFASSRNRATTVPSVKSTRPASRSRVSSKANRPASADRTDRIV